MSDLIMVASERKDRSRDLYSEILAIALDHIVNNKVTDSSSPKDTDRTIELLRACLVAVADIFAACLPRSWPIQNGAKPAAWESVWPAILRWMIYFDDDYHRHPRLETADHPSLFAALLQGITRDLKILQIVQNSDDLLMRVTRLWLQADVKNLCTHRWSAALSLPGALTVMVWAADEEDTNRIARRLIPYFGYTAHQVAVHCLDRLGHALACNHFGFLQLSLDFISIYSDTWEFNPQFPDIAQQLIKKGSIPLVARAYYLLSSHKSSNDEPAKVDVWRAVQVCAEYIKVHLHRHPEWVIATLKERMIDAIVNSAPFLDERIAQVMVRNDWHISTPCAFLDGTVITRGKKPVEMLEPEINGILSYVVGAHLIYPTVLRVIRRCLERVDCEEFISRLMRLGYPAFMPGTTLRDILTSAESAYSTRKEMPRVCHSANCLSNPNSPVRACSGCLAAFYCSRRCQKIAWKAEHKFFCFSLSRLPSDPGNKVRWVTNQSFLRHVIDGSVGNARFQDMLNKTLELATDSDSRAFGVMELNFSMLPFGVTSHTSAEKSIHGPNPTCYLSPEEVAKGYTAVIFQFTLSHGRIKHNLRLFGLYKCYKDQLTLIDPSSFDGLEEEYQLVDPEVSRQLKAGDE